LRFVPVTVVAIFLLINYLVFLVLRFVFQSAWLAVVVSAVLYYAFIRRVVTYVIFPGCFPVFRRKLEVNF